MPSVRVFISHSAHDDRSREIRDAIAAELRLARHAGRYVVLMDKIALGPGDAWRARINLWLGSCDVAVIILSKDALSSTYVAFETNVLGYRWACDHGFRVIPVLVGVTMADVKATPLAPSQVSEWQAEVVSGTADVSVVAESVEAALREVLPAATRPIERQANVLSGKLPEPPSDVYVRDVVELLGIDLPWQPDGALLVRLALQFLGSGMTLECARALRTFMHDAEFRNRRLLDVVELIASAWVDMKADEIPKLVQQPSPPALVLNAFHAELARMYVLSAKHRVAPICDWYFAEATPVLGEQSDKLMYVQRFVEAVRAELLELFGVDTDEEMDQALDDSVKLREPVIIVLQASGVDGEVIETLRATYAGVTFFLLTGAESLAPSVAGEIHFISPSLATDDEVTCLAQYQAFRQMVLKGKGNV